MVWSDPKNCKHCETEFKPTSWSQLYCVSCASECQVDGCDRKTQSNGYCGAHYRRMKKSGVVGAAYVRDPRGIPALRSKERKTITLNCEQCEKEFTVGHAVAHTKGVLTRKYCSGECQRSAKAVAIPTYTCASCGKITARHKGGSGGYNYNQRYCSKACQHKSLNKGGYIHHSGYKIIHVDGRRIEEHRYVMEQKLGRRLLPNETVHHRDASKTNNAPENLELWSSRHCRGARVIDQIRWAAALMRQYPEAMAEEKLVLVERKQNIAPLKLVDQIKGEDTDPPSAFGLMSFAA